MPEEKTEPLPGADIRLALAESLDRIDYLLTDTLPSLHKAIATASADLTAAMAGQLRIQALLDPLVDADFSLDICPPDSLLSSHLQGIADASRDITELHKKLLARLPLPPKGGASV